MPSSEVEILWERKSDAYSILCRRREKSQPYFFSLLRVSSRSKKLVSCTFLLRRLSSQQLQPGIWNWSPSRWEAGLILFPFQWRRCPHNFRPNPVLKSMLREKVENCTFLTISSTNFSWITSFSNSSQIALKTDQLRSWNRTNQLITEAPESAQLPTVSK